MIKRKLFKSIKVLSAVCITALTLSTVAIVGTDKGTVTAYAQEYYDSSDYHLNLDADNIWRCYNSNNQLDTNYDGIVENEYGWWKVTNGQVDFSYSGVVLNQYGWWKVTNGGVDFSFNGMAENQYGWWKFKNGTVDFSYNGMAQNEYGWWKIKNGTVDFSYNGMAENEYGWWKITNGTVDFSFNGLAENEYGWWKITNGGVDFSYNGLAKNQYGTWKVTNGAVDVRFTGIAENDEGEWYVVNGAVNYNYNGTVDYGNFTYNVENGKAVKQLKTAQRVIKWYDIDGSLLDEDTVNVKVDNNDNMAEDYYYNAVRVSKQYNIHSGYLTKICIGSTSGKEYIPDTLVKKGNLNLKDYNGYVSLYFVKVNKL